MAYRELSSDTLHPIASNRVHKGMSFGNNILRDSFSWIFSSLPDHVMLNMMLEGFHGSEIAITQRIGYG